MKKVNLLNFKALFPILLSLATGCGQTECSSFPSEDAAWFPSKVGDEIVFYNETDSIKLCISNLHMTDSYSLNKSCDCECQTSLYSKTNIDSSKLVSITASINYINYRQRELPPPISIEITNYELDNNMLIPLQDDSFNYDKSANSTFQDSAIINGKMFFKVLSIENNNNSKFTKLTVSKGFGIIEITDKESNVWKREIKK